MFRYCLVYFIYIYIYRINLYSFELLLTIMILITFIFFFVIYTTFLYLQLHEDVEVMFLPPPKPRDGDTDWLDTNGRDVEGSSYVVRLSSGSGSNKCIKIDICSNIYILNFSPPIPQTVFPQGACRSLDRGLPIPLKDTPGLPLLTTTTTCPRPSNTFLRQYRRIITTLLVTKVIPPILA